MSDPHLPPDPVDQAYVEAEAVLSDEAARAARRQRVLAAVASQGKPAVRSPLWRRGGWLAAASVAALSLVLASQLYRPIPPPARPAAGPPVQAPAHGAAAPTSPPAPPIFRPVNAVPPPMLKPTPPVYVSPSPAAPPVAAPAARAFPEPAPPPPPPPPPPEAGAAASGGAPPADQADASNAAGPPEVSEMVVTAQKREQSVQRVPVAISAFTAKQRDVTGINSVQDITNFADLGARLRAAAEAGRSSEVKSLLKHHAPVDAADDNGDTALMAAVQADHPAVAKLLIRHGANLDLTNQAGQSARGMAKSVGDPKLDQALGLSP